VATLLFGDLASAFNVPAGRQSPLCNPAGRYRKTETMQFDDRGNQTPEQDRFNVRQAQLSHIVRLYGAWIVISGCISA
jgi:hypothetical protein